MGLSESASTLPIPFNFGNSVFDQAAGVTTPGTPQTLITHTVPASTTRRLFNIIVTCRQPGKIVILLNEQLIISGRTSPSENNVHLPHYPPRILSEGDIIKVTFTAMSGSPATDVEAYLQADDI